MASFIFEVPHELEFKTALRRARRLALQLAFLSKTFRKPSLIYNRRSCMFCFDCEFVGVPIGLGAGTISASDSDIEVRIDLPSLYLPFIKGMKRRAVVIATHLMSAPVPEADRYLSLKGELLEKAVRDSMNSYAETNLAVQRFMHGLSREESLAMSAFITNRLKMVVGNAREEFGFALECRREDEEREKAMDTDTKKLP